MEEKKGLSKVLTFDLTHIFLIFVTSIVIITLSYYFKNFIYSLIPTYFFSNIAVVMSLIILIPVFVIFLGNIVLLATFYYFQLLLMIIILTVLFVAIGYYIIYVIIGYSGLTIKRTKNQNIAKIIGFYTGISTGVFLVIYTFPLENLFNFNIVTLFLVNFMDYVDKLFQFVFEITTNGLIFGFIAILITDLFFYMYHKKKKFKIVQKVSGYEYTTKRRI